MIRFSQIDAGNRWAHTMLTADDLCYYLYEYTPGRGHESSCTNMLIRNLKKKPSQSDKPGYRFKDRAIERCAEHLREALDPQWAKQATFIPVPGSKAASHPDHDDRIERICRNIASDLDVRPLVTQRFSTNAAHESGKGGRVTVEKLVRMYEIDETQADPEPRAFAIVDDVLTSGTHYRAVQTKLVTRWPGVPIIGLFIARRIFAPGKGRNQT
ncbi:hypothetical protein SAMN05428974_0582 [Sphingopyxis sp. YR583]|uniref:hypothetical protein n=1 Tax=Sphingopyxis sp. YR583 TaxID=1881047 RepID=UPI0008A7C2FF|nr:hypothetical protein [Sphingopyxis sp. YR583]SEH12867.1 hypothetical protein SAMN05428974_0582 [Sphingopyxis sp. YR583]